VRVLAAQDTARVAELIPIRHQRMAESAFAFYRGACAVMAADLGAQTTSGVDAQMCGDAHLLNFGGFAAPDRRLVFSLNDFDETMRGPFEWDVQRLAASFAIACRANGFAADRRHPILLSVLGSYRRAMRSFAAMRSLDIWYARLDVDQIVRRFGADVGAAEMGTLRRVVMKAEAHDNIHATARFTRMIGGKRRFVDMPPTLVRLDELDAAGERDHLATAAGELLPAYLSTLSADRRLLLERFEVTDIARKVVGVGSVGMRAWVMLLVGRDDDDPLVLQFKEAQPSVYEPYLGPSGCDNHAQRVVEGQRMMQAATDILLGWQRTPGFDGVDRDQYVRQMWDMKGSADITTMTPRGMHLYADMCGWTLARAHARSGDPVAIAAYLGASDVFDRSMATFAEAYADQNELDHAALTEAVSRGSMSAGAPDNSA